MTMFREWCSRAGGAILVMSALLTATACGGDGEGASAASEAPAITEADLTSALLEPSELTIGEFEEREVLGSDTPEAVKVSGDGCGLLLGPPDHKLEAVDGVTATAIRGYEQYELYEDFISITQTIQAFNTVATLKDALSRFENVASQCAEFNLTDPGGSLDYATSLAEFPAVGDDRVAIRLDSEGVSSGLFGVTATSYLIVVQVGNVIDIIDYYGPEDGGTRFVETIVEASLEKIEETI